MTTTIKCYVSLTNGSAVVSLTAGNAGNAGLNLSAPNVTEDMLLVLQDPINAIRFVKGSLSTTSIELQEPWNGTTVTNAEARISTSGAAISVLTQAIRDLIAKYAAVPYGNDGLTLADTMMRIVGSVDPSKIVKFEVDGLTTGTTRTVTVPDADVTIPTQAQMDAKFDKAGGAISGNVNVTGSVSATSNGVFGGAESTGAVRIGDVSGGYAIVGARNSTGTLGLALRYSSGGSYVDGALLSANALNLAGTKGIKFQAAQSPSSDANTLDDYEEGTWTPELLDDDASTSVYTYTSRSGRYIKIGRAVHLWCSVNFSVNTSATPASGYPAIKLRGMPFSNSVWGDPVSHTSFSLNSSLYSVRAIWQYGDVILFGKLSAAAQNDANDTLFWKTDCRTAGNSLVFNSIYMSDN